MVLHAQQKGKRGEDLFCKWLSDNLQISVRRNHWQSDGHSADVIVDDFIFEIKNRESHSLDDYWLQILRAKQGHENPDLIPVVAFKSNRQKWQFLIPAALITGINYGYVIAPEKVFIQFAKYVIEG